MRKSFWIFFIAILAVCIVLLLRGKRHQEAPLPSPTIATTNNPSNPVGPSQVAQLPVRRPSLEALTNIVNVETSPGKTTAISSYILSKWQGQINFYGRVIDEDSNPVNMAKIHFQWNEFPTEDGMRNADIQSDAQGLFSLEGALGLTLKVSVGKNGYYSSRMDNDFYTYGSLGGAKFFPDSQNPVVFHLRKKGEGTSLIQEKFPPGIGQIWQLHHNGTPIELDLLNGSQNPQGSGQLKMELFRDLSDRNARKFDWKLQLSILGGGLVPTDEEFAFEAPQSGYQPSIIISMPATNQDWNDSFTAKYYIQLPNGDYGRFDLNLSAYNGAFRVQSVINPSGSRNLEPAQ